MVRILLFTAVLLFTSQPALALVAEFKSSAAVDAAAVTLGDIALFDEDSELAAALASQIIDQAPPPGKTVSIDARNVIKKVAPFIPGTENVIWNGSSTVALTRNSIRINPTQIDQIIAEYIDANRHELPEADIQFIPSSLPMPFLLPTGQVTWDVIPSSPSILGSTRFSLIFKVDGRVRKNMSVRGRLEALATAAVAATSLRKGTLLTPEHLIMAMVDISNLKDPCVNKADIAGKKLNRSIKAGSPVLLGNVVFPPTVRKGEVVKMIVKKGNMSLIATGIARTDGKMDQTIRVQNINSKKTVYCRVAAPGIVEVTL